MRRLISLVSALVAILALGLVLYNATTLDRRPPEVKVISLSAPAGDSRVAQTLTAIDIEFTEPVRPATFESRFAIVPAVDGAFSWDGSVAIFTPSHELPADTMFTIRIQPGFEDLAGNADTAGVDGWDFRTVGAPLVLRTTPADGATGVPTSAALELVFNRLMDTASVESALRVDPSTPVTATWSGSVVTLDFGAALRFGTTYTVTIGAGAADTGGSELAAPFVTRFTTVGAGLGVSTVVPGDGVAGIGVATPIVVQFDAPIDPATARSALRITPSVDGSLSVGSLPTDVAPAAAPSASPAPDTLIFVPSTELAPNTTYTVTLAPTVARLGDPTIVNPGRTWSFTTGSPTSSGQNQIAFLSDRSGVRNVWVMNPDGTNQRQLTVELAPVSSFDATTDGRLVAYAAAGVVTVMSVDGRDVHRVTASDGRHDYAPTFSPDDSALLVARRDAAGTDQGIWLVPLTASAGQERQVLASGAPPLGSAQLGGDGIGMTDGTPVWIPRAAFDPTGHVALVATADGQVQLLDLEAEATSPVSVPIRADAAPVWDAGRNGFIVAATDETTARRALYVVATSGAITVLAGTDGAAGPIAVAPGGSLAVLRRAPDGTATLIVVNRTGAIRTLPGPADSDDRWPAFSPDGSSLLVGRTLVASPERSAGLWLLDAATGASRQLAAGGAYARWIP